MIDQKPAHQTKNACRREVVEFAESELVTTGDPLEHCRELGICCRTLRNGILTHGTKHASSPPVSRDLFHIAFGAARALDCCVA